jgi:zinc transport system substrate-binding protein
MRFKGFIFIVVCALILPFLATGEQLSVAVTLPPQAFIVKQIGGEYVSVSVLLNKGQEPHSFAPTSKDIIRLSTAKLYLTLRLPVEMKLKEKLKSVKRLSIIDMSKGVKYRTFSDQKNSVDPHVWLGPKQLTILATNTAEALSTMDAKHTFVYKKNCQAFIKRLNDLNSINHKLLAKIICRKVFVFHPAFGYFLDEYNLEQVAVEQEGKSTTTRQLESLIRDARKSGVRTILAEPQFDSKNVFIIAKAIKGSVVKIDALDENILKTIEKLGKTIANDAKEKK